MGKNQQNAQIRESRRRQSKRQWKSKRRYVADIIKKVSRKVDGCKKLHERNKREICTVARGANVLNVVKFSSRLHT